MERLGAPRGAEEESMDDGNVREAPARAYRWHWPWYRLILLYICSMILGVTLALLLFRLWQEESVVVPVLCAVAMLLATANEIRDA
jgi:hypothetical protein